MPRTSTASAKPRPASAGTPSALAGKTAFPDCTVIARMGDARRDVPPLTSQCWNKRRSTTFSQALRSKRLLNGTGDENALESHCCGTRRLNPDCLCAAREMADLHHPGDGNFRRYSIIDLHRQR